MELTGIAVDELTLVAGVADKPGVTGVVGETGAVGRIGTVGLAEVAGCEAGWLGLFGIKQIGL